MPPEMRFVNHPPVPFVRCLICYGDAGCSRVDKAFDEEERERGRESVAFDSRIGRKITGEGVEQR